MIKKLSMMSLIICKGIPLGLRFDSRRRSFCVTSQHYSTITFDEAKILLLSLINLITTPTKFFPFMQNKEEMYCAPLCGHEGNNLLISIYARIIVDASSKMELFTREYKLNFQFLLQVCLMKKHKIW